ncbi:MAG: hypothetical protein E7029_12040 [Planctomycetaceae bacterium]|nr:hypothetical protein [Planctomycetaceae bacterium]
MPTLSLKNRSGSSFRNGSGREIHGKSRAVVCLCCVCLCCVCLCCVCLCCVCLCCSASFRKIF